MRGSKIPFRWKEKKKNPFECVYINYINLVLETWGRDLTKFNSDGKEINDNNKEDEEGFIIRGE